MAKFKTDVCVCQEGYRRGVEVTYYGSDLNKWVMESCSKEMTHINIDGLSYKRSKKIIRIIESKHSKEGMPKSQREILEIFGLLFKKINKRMIMFEYKFECYVIRGDYPYEFTNIIDLVEETEFILDQENLRKFLQFDEYQIHKHIKIKDGV